MAHNQFIFRNPEAQPSSLPSSLPSVLQINFNKIPLNIRKSNWIVKYCTNEMLLDIIKNELNVIEIIFSIEFNNFPNCDMSEIFKNLRSLVFLKYPSKNTNVNKLKTNFSNFNYTFIGKI